MGKHFIKHFRLDKETNPHHDNDFTVKQFKLSILCFMLFMESMHFSPVARFFPFPCDFDQWTLLFWPCSLYSLPFT